MDRPPLLAREGETAFQFPLALGTVSNYPLERHISASWPLQGLLLKFAESPSLVPLTESVFFFIRSHIVFHSFFLFCFSLSILLYKFCSSQGDMWPRAVLHVLLGTFAVVNAAPQLLELRDAGNQPVCVPISPILHDVSDLAAKIRPENGICNPNQILSSSNNTSRAGLVALADDPYVCSEDKPCGNGACCGKTGNCGYGEDYCGTNGESPNDVCWSNCDAHAECGRHADPPGKTCPLNVCCSQYGFCGTTSEFCDEGENDDDGNPTGCQSNCDQPSSGAADGDVQKRIIGYYEVWNHNKMCINMGIDDIPVESITHLYYSFGYIMPETFEIVPMDDGGDSEAVSEFTFSAIAGLKKKNPDLKVILALGGWTFNDNHTIWQPVFSNMVSTENNRILFTLMATQFINRYGFDGLDFDWEYPGAGDRGGHPEDGENFTKLLKFLRNFLEEKDIELSFTAPTSYWVCPAIHPYKLILLTIEVPPSLRFESDVRRSGLCQCHGLRPSWDMGLRQSNRLSGSRTYKSDRD
jgi:hypothetical protein